MASFYDRADMYDLFEDESRYQIYKQHWETIFAGKNIHTMLDVSIGSGSVTLPVLELGVELSGSDLSEMMLKNCEKKAKKANHSVVLKRSDFRKLDCWKEKKFDIVASTGNSLGYVCNADVVETLEQMDAHVVEGGYLYFDTRNWDKIVSEHQRFYLYNPLFDGSNRINVIQVWDYHEDNSMTFNILYTFEKNNKIFQKEVFEEHYFPIPKSILIQKLESMGYENIELFCFPAQSPMKEFEMVDWYTVLARKPRR